MKFLKWLLSLFHQKPKTPAKSTDEIRKLRMELIESTLKCSGAANRIGDYERHNKVIEYLLSEDIIRHQAALRILGLPDDADHTKLITTEFVSKLRNIT